VLKNLTVRNFKSIVEATMPFSTINVLIGENGSGKSSVAQALALLKQSLGNQQLRFSGDLLDLGGFSDVLSRSATTQQVEFGVEGGMDVATSLARLVAGDDSTLAIFKDHLIADSSGISRYAAVRQLGHARFEAEWSPRGGSQVSPQTVRVSTSSVNVGGQGIIGYPMTTTGGSGPLPTDQVTWEQATGAVNGFINAGGSFLDRIYLVPAVRGIERQSYDLGEQPSSQFNSAEGSVRVGQALASTLAYRQDLEGRISSWMTKITQRDVVSRLTAGRKVTLGSVTNDNTVNIINEGFGTNQLAHVLTQLALLPKDALLIIEEPEVHLHPAAHSRLVSVLVQAVRHVASQLLLTTHSEHILYALMALVAERVLKPDDVAIYNVTNSNGVTQLKMLGLDNAGRISGGLPGFFDANLSEFRRYLDAFERQK
jgi:Fe-S cluster assembly ATPase SufC